MIEKGLIENLSSRKLWQIAEFQHDICDVLRQLARQELQNRRYCPPQCNR